MGLDFMCFTIPLLLTVGFNIPSVIKRSANEEEGRGGGEDEESHRKAPQE
jgi:hypothetical protein